MSNFPDTSHSNIWDTTPKVKDIFLKIQKFIFIAIVSHKILSHYLKDYIQNVYVQPNGR